MAQAEKENTTSTKNPLLWVSLIVIGLIIFIFAASDRGGVGDKKVNLKVTGAPDTEQPEGAEIDREISMLPGLRAREFIHQIRQKGKPYAFDEVMARAAMFAAEGSLADAHLVYFFAAREGHIEAMMVMAEMSDPTMFHADNNLLDHADAVQAYKWYKQSLQSGFEPARERLQNLQQWATAEARFGNASAQQLLLNFN